MSNFGSKDWLIEVAKGNVPGYSTVHKFGSYSAVPSTIVPITTSATYQTPTSAQSIEAVSTDNTNDVAGGNGARQITIVGLDATGAEQTVTVNLNGTTAVAVSGTWIRVYRAWVSESGTYATSASPSHASTITIRNSGGGITWAIISNVGGFGLGQTQIGAYTVPLGHTAYILSITYSIESSKASSLYFFKRGNILDVTAPYDAMRVQNVYNGVVGNGEFIHRTNEGYEALTDIGFMGAYGGGGTANIAVEFELLLRQDGY